MSKSHHRPQKLLKPRALSAREMFDDVAIQSFVMFAVIFGLLCVIIYLISPMSIMREWTTALAKLTGSTLNAIGVHSTVEGGSVITRMRILAIIPECTAVFIIAVWIALICAYPLPAQQRVKGLIAGIAVILVANYLRLVAIGIAAQFVAGDSFNVIHDYLFQLFMVAIVVLLWWVMLVRTLPEQPAENTSVRVAYFIGVTVVLAIVFGQFAQWFQWFPTTTVSYLFAPSLAYMLTKPSVSWLQRIIWSGISFGSYVGTLWLLQLIGVSSDAWNIELVVAQKTVVSGALLYAVLFGYPVISILLFARATRQTAS